MRLLEYPNSKFWCYIIRAPSIASSYDMTLLGRQIDRDTAVSYSTWSGWHLFFYAQHVTSWCNKLMDWRSKWALKHWEDQKGNDHYKLKQNLQGQVPGVPFQNCNQEMDNARDRTVIPAYVMPNSSVIDSTYPDHFGAVICMAVHFFLGDNRLQAPKRFLVLQSIRCVAARKANKWGSSLYTVNREPFQASAFSGGNTLQRNTSQFIYNHKLQELQKREELFVYGIQQQGCC